MLDEETHYYNFDGQNAGPGGGAKPLSQQFVYDPLSIPNVFIFMRGGLGSYSDNLGLHGGKGGDATLDIRPKTTFEASASDHAESISATVIGGDGAGGGAATITLQQFEYDFGKLEIFLNATGGGGSGTGREGNATITITDNRMRFQGAFTQIALIADSTSSASNQSGVSSINFTKNVIGASDEANSIGFSLSGESGTTPNTHEFQALFSYDDFDLGAGNDQLLFYMSGGARLLLDHSSFDGGAGFDSLSFEDARGVTIDLFEDGFRNFEFVLGGAGNDTIYGNDEDTMFMAGAGTNLVDGRDGNDTFYLGTGTDTYIGGQGIDTLDMSFSSVGATVKLWTGQAVGDGHAMVSEIENVVGTDFADTIEGDLTNNDLIGGGGNDKLKGMGGHDLLEGGLGDDMLDGIGGIATAVYGRGTEAVGNVLTDGVTVSLNIDLLAQNTGRFGWDTLFNITNAWGTNANDIIIGSSADNELVGFNGNDYIAGLAGNDRLFGEAGNDILDGGPGADSAFGGSGDDLFYVDNAADETTELAGGGFDTIVASTSYAMRNWTEKLILQGNQAFDARGTNTADIIIGNDLANQIDGLAGADLLYGGKGNDTYFVDTAGDIVFENANEGIDTVYASSGYYLFDNIENLVLGDNTLPFGLGDFLGQILGGLFTFNNDFFGVGNALDNIITGNSGSNLLLGGGGADTIRAGAGVDLLYGEAGNDQLFGDAGNDVLVGGIGDDALDGGAGGDSLYGEDGNDTLTGGSDFVFDQLVGGNGDDVLRGDSGLGDYDYLYGNAGDDSFYVDTPNDLVFEQAGEGTDTVYANITGAGYYLYANIENLVLLGNTPFGVGNDLANRLTGNASANFLLGGAGDDVLNGKAGNDVLFGEAGADRFVFEHGTGGDVIGDFTPGSDKIDLTAIGYSWQQVQNSLHQNGGSTAIDLGGGDVVVLNGVTAAQLHQADFILAGGSSGSASATAPQAADIAPPQDLSIVDIWGAAGDGHGHAFIDWFPPNADPITMPII